MNLTQRIANYVPSQHTLKEKIKKPLIYTLLLTQLTSPANAGVFKTIGNTIKWPFEKYAESIKKHPHETIFCTLAVGAAIFLYKNNIIDKTDEKIPQNNYLKF